MQSSLFGGTPRQENVEASASMIPRSQARPLRDELLVGGRDDDVARAADACGIAISLVNYTDELPYFRDEVLPRLERANLRESLVSAP